MASLTDITSVRTQHVARPGAGLRRRLLAAFIGLSSLVVIAAAIAVLSLWMTRRSLETISNGSIPITMTSLDLTRVAQQIVETVPELVAAKNPAEQSDLTTRLDAHVEELGKTLERLRHYEVDARGAAAIERSATLFSANIDSINRMVSARIAVETDLQSRLDAGLAATTSLLEIIGSETADLEGTDRVLEAEPTYLARRMGLLDGRAETQQVELLLQNFDSGDRLLLSGRISRSLERIDAALQEIDPGDRAAVTKLLETIGAASNNIAQLGNFRAQLSDAAGQALTENADLAARFAAAVDRMIEAARDDVEAAKEAAAGVQRTAFWMLLSVVLATLVSSFLIVRYYVHRNILARLTALTGSMLAIASGDLSARVPQATSDELGSMAAALSVFRDTAVEVRDSNLREIQETRSRLYHAIENIQEGFALFDADDRLTLANAPFAHLLLGSGSEVPVGESYEALIERMSNLRIAGDDPGTWRKEALAYHRDPVGTLIWQLGDEVWLGATERRTDDGGRVMVVTDLTATKRHEKELDDLVAKLQKASAAKSSFIANVSHELRTPLTAVLGFAQIVQNRLENVIFPKVANEDVRSRRSVDQVRENIGIMIAEGQRLTKMINDILDLEKIEAGQMVWDIEPLDIGSVIRQAAAATNSLYTSKGLAFHIDIAADLPHVAGDRDRLVQVIINLISNAVKFTSRGHVACVARPGQGPFVSVAISDTGVGIAPEDQAEVFDKFRQVGDTLTEKPAGTGLGLPICREIIENLGGTITVESMPGYGSTFTFQIPLAETRAAPIQTARSSHGS